MKNIIMRNPLLSKKYHECSPIFNKAKEYYHECSSTFNKVKVNEIMPLLSWHEESKLAYAYIRKEAREDHHPEIFSTSLFCNLLLMC